MRGAMMRGTTLWALVAGWGGDWVSVLPARADKAAGVRVPGVIQQLVCRGNPTIDLRASESPWGPDFIMMELRYQRSEEKAGWDYAGLAPGTCTWNPLGFPSIPREPGTVSFQVRREAQLWSATDTRPMDTTYQAAAFFPDPVTLPRYLSIPDHYWSFFVDDATNVAISHGAWKSGVTAPTYVMITGPITLATPVAEGGDVPGVGTRPPGGQGTTVDAPIARQPDKAVATTRDSAMSRTTRQGSATVTRAPAKERTVGSGIRNVRLKSTAEGLRLRFTAPTGVRPQVQISKKPPIWNPVTKGWEYPEGRTSTWFATIEGGGPGYSAKPHGRLDPETRYHYLITIYGDEAATPPRMRTGTFTTPRAVSGR